ncbi:MAG: helix-turn-helix transcriptional regulator [Hydrogenophaga sp.]|uniref:helix-turn-helix domain-containing protein n=1 Tax=Hydrogenophaga sp. TaxID=1904254 RepID=UPI0027199AF3|nr:helix-turn-helix transcriptional regulator [Hydrogenophaga sp.]MDO9568086.1 helix-turn-helix transcriptional regulator [Hydrogenophaga sp.]MDP3374359.1 helix-turn-helix transcriptional regulator [Hydrogenophaga sp.]
MSNVITNDRFATRLRRERERLGLTQQEFAAKVGVSRMSQVNYESGKRYPGEEYFTNLKKIKGLDRFYLAIGQHEHDTSDATIGALHLFHATAEALDLDNDAFSVAWEEMTQCAAINVPQDTPESWRQIEETACRYAKDVLSHSPVILNEDAFLEVLQRIEEVLTVAESPTVLSPQKKARLVLMLYRQYRSAGKLDWNVIYDAILLAG